MLAPVRAVRQSASIALVVALGIVTLANPAMGIVGALGALFSAALKWNDSSVPITKRRALGNVWSMFGGYTMIMGLLCGLTIVLSLLIGHLAILGPIMFFTLLACWLPFVTGILGKNRR